MRYCGFELTCEEVERLFHFLHANYSQEELIMMDDETLHRRAEESQEEWQLNDEWIKKYAEVKRKMKKCKHEHTRYLNCEFHGNSCNEIVCCACGESCNELRP